MCLALHFGPLLAAQPEADVAHGEGLNFAGGGADTGNVAAFQNQLGRALPADGLAVLTVARVQAEIASSHVQLAWHSCCLGNRQRGIERGFQLGLHRVGIGAISHRVHGDGQHVLLHFNRTTGGELNDVLRGIHWYLLGKKAISPRQHCESSYVFGSDHE